ncbi:hypothetical protein KCU65_g5254, partial [Aureobasidium melanogenum]
MDSPNPLDRILRTTTLISFFPALGLLIPYGIVSNTVFPALGLVPAFFSAILGLLSLMANFRWSQLVLYMDMFLAISILSILLPFWVLGAGRRQWRDSAGVVMLGTYGTVSLLMNFWIHVFFVLRHLFRMCNTLTLTRTCPNCRTNIRAGFVPSITRVPAEKSRHSCESEALYQPLDTDAHKYDDDARVSSEAGTLYRPSMDTLGSTETVVKLI